MVTAVIKLKDTCSLEKSYDKPRWHIKKQRHHFADKALVKAMVFPVAMYGCESWTIKETEHEELMPSNVVMEKTVESPLDWKRVKPVKPKGNQPWILTGRTDAEAPVLGHLMWRANSLEKTLMLGTSEGKRRRGWQRIRWTQWTWIWADSAR